MNRTPAHLPQVVLVLLVLCSGCGDQRMRGRIASLDDKSLIEIQDNYPPQSKLAQFIAEEIKRRNISMKPTPSAPAKTPSRRVAEALPKAKPQPLIPYTVISREEYFQFKVSFDLRVDLVDGRLPSEKELGAVSEHIKSQEKPHDRTFVSFLLPGMLPGSGSFASAHHKPEMEVKIYPNHVPDQYTILLMTDQQRTESQAPSVGSEKVLGRWMAKAPAPAVVTFLDRNGTVFMTRLYDDGSRGEHEMVIRKVGSETRYSEKGSKTSEYLVITSDGHLAHGDDEGIWQISQRVQ